MSRFGLKFARPKDFLQNDEGLDVQEIPLRPSEISRLKVLETVKIDRPPLIMEMPSLTRIFKQSVQRVHLTHQSLASCAAFLLTCDENKTVLVWIGSSCDFEDRQLAMKLGLDVLRRDYGNLEAVSVPLIIEDLETPRELNFLLEKCWTDESVYMNKIVRDNRINFVPTNDTINVYALESIVGDTWGLRAVSSVAPSESGEVVRTMFPNITFNTIAAVNIGEFWNLWTARGATSQEIDLARNFLSSHMATRLSTSEGMVQSAEVLKRLTVVKQGCERVLFRMHFKLFTNFEPVGRTVVYEPSSGANRKRQNQKKAKSTTAAVDAQPVQNNAAFFDFINMFGTAPTPSPSGADKPLAAASSSSAAPRKDVAQSAGPVVRFEDEQGPYNTMLGDSAYEPVQDMGMDKESGPETALNNASYSVKVSQGQQLLEPAMLEIVDKDSLVPAQRLELIEAASASPNVLLGWQIEIDDGRYAGVSVVTGVKKSFVLKKSLFRLSSTYHEDIWVPLCRSPKKRGVHFRPLRKVLELL